MTMCVYEKKSFGQGQQGKCASIDCFILETTVVMNFCRRNITIIYLNKLSF
jgi:hypothetical protein